MSHSIQRHLLQWLTAAILLAAMLQAGWQYQHALGLSDAVFDYHLRQLTLAVRDQVQTMPPGATTLTRSDRDVVVQVWETDGRRSYRSHRDVALPQTAMAGFTTLDSPQGRWRVYTIVDGGRTIQAGQSLQLREAAAARAAAHALIGPIALGTLLSLLAWFVVRRGLRPIGLIAAQVSARAPSNLSPVSSSQVPAEVMPLLSAFNQLLERLKDAQSAQQRLITDAAHALRSPLTALSLQLQQLDDTTAPGDSAQRARLAAGVARATRLVQQLLLLARSDAATDAVRSSAVRLDMLARNAIADALPLADAAKIDLGMVQADAASVWGDPDLLTAMLANLIDNAIRHAGGGARVDVAVQVLADAVLVEVGDSGPGIPAPERLRVTERFYRPANATAGGTGLGLSIVRSVVERYGGELHLDVSELGGLLVQVRLPRAAKNRSAA